MPTNSPTLFHNDSQSHFSAQVQGVNCVLGSISGIVLTKPMFTSVLNKIPLPKQ